MQEKILKKVLLTCLLLAVFLTACNNKKTIQSTEKKQTQSTEQVAESKISWNQSPADIKKMKAKLKKYLKENKIKFESINYEKNSYDKYGIFPEDQINDKEKKYLPNDVCYFLVFIPEDSETANPATAVFVRTNKTWKLSSYYKN